jgi:uncharacterized protein (TIRG00374 family)
MVLLSIGIFFALIAASTQFADMEQIQSQIHKIDRDIWIILLASALLNYIFRGYRWHFFAENLNMYIPLPRLALYYACGFALVTTPGKIGTALRLWLIKKHHDYSYSRTASMMVMDQLTDLIAMILLAVVGLFTFHYVGIALFLAIGFLCAVIILLYRPSLIFLLLDKANKIMNQPKFFNAIGDIVINTKSLLSPSLFSFTTILAIAGWSVSSFSFYLLLQHLGADVNILTAFFIFNCASVLGALSMLPGGIGSAEIIMVGLLISVGVPNDIAIVSTAVIRVVTLWFAVGIGFISLPFGLKTAKKAK